MANINKIKLSGTTYNIQDENATKTVELTQAQYDALAVKDPNTFYIITDATAGDLSNYYTKSETSGATEISTALASKADTATTYTKTEVDTALASKQTTLTAGTGISIIDNVISATGGTSITIDPSLDSGSTNPVANSAITEATTANQNAVLITSENKNSIVEHIENDIYELKTNDIYSISFIPKDLEYTKFRFQGSINGNYTDVTTNKNVDTATTQISITFDSETNRITVTSLDRDANKIDVLNLMFKKTYYEDLEISDVYIIHNPSLGVAKTEYEKTIQTSYKQSGGYITERKGNTEIKYNYETTSTSNLVNGSAVNAAINKVKTRFDAFGQSYKGGNGCTDYASQSPNITDFTSGEHSVTLSNTQSSRVWWFNIKLNENSTDTFGDLSINFSADGTSFGNLSLFLRMNTLKFRLGDLIKRIDVTDKTQTYSVFVPNGILVNTAYHSAVASYNVWSMTEGEPFFLESIGIFSIPQDSSCLESFDEWKSNVDTDISNLSASTDYAVNTVNNHINDSTIHVTSTEKSTWNAKQDQLVSGTNIKTINNESILGSGNITIEGGGSSYTAGDGIDITNDVISVTGKVDTTTYNSYTAATDTALGGKQATLVSGTNIKTINNESILGSGNIDIQGGGGKAVSAGTNISITTGETADTINCTLPIKKIQGRESVIIGDSRNTVDGNANVAVGYQNSIIPKGSSYTPDHCFVGGEHNNVYNTNETAFGLYNNSIQNKLVGGASGTTLFSVGNGTYSARHNAFEIRQNGDIYITKDGQDVKLQDQLGGGGGGMTEDDELLLSTALTDLNDRKIDASEVKENYQKKGDYVTTNTLNTRLAEYETALDEQNVEEVTAYALNDLNDRFGGLKLTKITESEYAALTTKDENTLYIVVADPSQTR